MKQSEAEYLSSWPCLTSHSLNLNTLSCLRCSSDSLSVKKGSKSEEGDEITEAEAGATGFEDVKEGASEPRNAGSL